ncbi:MULTISPECIES: DUF4373 domain-containing protein [Olivibacter]|uniref:DUF4373 domain-containing protein n=1 Tax=Olivibacter jilunii TaxID=985016 RepID=A0ABW6AWJ1_9SPHI
MARPTKQGLDYFTIDVDFFQNRKVRKINRACGAASTAILICLLCNSYRDKGYYIEWDEDLPFDISDEVGVSEGAVKEVIAKAVQVGFFDEELYKRYSILTSEEIQRRFKSSTLKRSEIIINSDYWIIDGRNGVIDVKNSVNTDGSTQSKVKKSKVKESKEEGTAVPSGMTDEEIIVAADYIENVEKEKSCAKKEKVSIELPFAEEEFADLWKRWKEYKKREHRFQYKTADSEQSALKDLFNKSGRQLKYAVMIINKSISNGWKGFFPLKKEDYAEVSTGRGQGNSTGKSDLSNLKNLAENVMAGIESDNVPEYLRKRE